MTQILHQHADLTQNDFFLLPRVDRGSEQTKLVVIERRWHILFLLSRKIFLRYCPFDMTVSFCLTPHFGVFFLKPAAGARTKNLFLVYLVHQNLV